MVVVVEIMTTFVLYRIALFAKLVEHVETCNQFRDE